MTIFTHFGYMDNIFQPSLCQEMVDRMDSWDDEGYNILDPQVPRASSFYGIFNDLLEYARPFVEGYTGLDLIPTYTFARRYTKGDILSAHIDREACEISFTVCLKNIGNDGWAIHMKNPETKLEQSFTLQPGSAVVYRGMDNIHWRTELESGIVYQAFFHYVDSNGKCANFKYDSKEKILDPSECIELTFPI